MGSGEQIGGMNTHLRNFPGKKEAVWTHRWKVAQSGRGETHLTANKPVLVVAKHKDAYKEKEVLCDFMFSAHESRARKAGNAKGATMCPADGQRPRPRYIRADFT